MTSVDTHVHRLTASSMINMLLKVKSYLRKGSHGPITLWKV